MIWQTLLQLEIVPRELLKEKPQQMIIGGKERKREEEEQEDEEVGYVELLVTMYKQVEKYVPDFFFTRSTRILSSVSSIYN
jgi:hypothetical protein